MPRIEPVPWEFLSDEQRAEIEASHAAGRSRSPAASQVLAYSPAAFRAMKASYRCLFRQGVIEPRLDELLRLRSAIRNGCDPCAASRKEESVGEEDVACLRQPLPTGLSRRESLALAFMDRLANDHESIDDAVFRELAEVFSTAEIVELGWRCAQAIGAHRFIHCLDILGESEPVIRFDPEQIDRSTASGDATA